MASIESRTEAEAVVGRLFAALQAHDVKTLVEGCTDDVVLIAPGGLEIQGRSEYATYVKGWIEAFPDLQWDITNMSAAGDTVVIESNAAGTHLGTLHTPDGRRIPATGRRFTNRLCEVDVVRDGSLAVTRLYWDNMTIMQQLGLLSEEAKT